MTLVALPEPDQAGRHIDRQAAERAAADLLVALGADLADEGLRETPRRMADALCRAADAGAVPADDVPERRGLRRARGRPLDPVPLAVHAPPAAVPRRGAHRLPAGGADPRTLEVRPRRGAVRPRPADPGAAHGADRRLAAGASGSPKGVGVVLEAEHMCMSLRGVQKFGARTVTSALHGLVRDDPRTRQEFLALTTRIDHAH